MTAITWGAMPVARRSMTIAWRWSMATTPAGVRARRRAVDRWPRWRPMHVRAAIPVIALTIEGAVGVVIAPIGTDHKAHDRQADTWAIILYIDGLVLIQVLQVTRCDPAAIRADDDIAPFVALHTALDIDADAGGNDIDGRITDIRTGAQVYVRNDNTFGRLSPCGKREGEYCRHQPSKAFHRVTPVDEGRNGTLLRRTL